MPTISSHRQMAGLAVCAALVCLSQVAALAQPSRPRYRVNDLGTLRGGFQTVASSINNNGVVTGQASTGLSRDMEGPYHPFLYTGGGKIEDLGLVPGYIWGSGGRINERNQFIAYQFAEIGGPGTPFLYSDGQFYNLHQLMGEQAFANTINDQGAIVGSEIQPGTFQYVAIIYTNGVLRRLGTLVPGGSSFAMDVNNAGTIIGYAYLSATSDRPFHAVIFSGDQVVDLGVPFGLESSSAWRINRAGHILGNSVSATPERSRGFILRNGQVVDLGTLPGDTNSLALDFNNSDEVVGTSYHIGDGGYVFHPVLITADGIWDLQTLIPAHSGWNFQAAVGINDRGQILMVGQDGFGPQRTLLLTPLAGE